ncbi:ImmA/IrrE family metallo-endopeptidase [Leptospira bourretii]|uniref:ImmA/IrrE family metallo-endopeptidase n=1 Tax=Leptospira bourretii TaxID=2484962 RepID=A0A4R9IHQ9_9LEPT|nr:ImmA/IrrE family metallo-endopeptidase [Leptospira bourretii]TGK87957.1 ImmA/IrrE family metallo-endopeptidase [Leptospira bourretii]TGK88609.1 ImmA/IrrE family metallo-endopeptidase [Leptospira bourretii]TGL20556.1 ImmA/IrrE family metallo-endopeptidase [Leptospira bourretii]TGL26851.1 ImmA/IrrE family metallo-endopeptidase [Leptospira bourretii]
MRGRKNPELIAENLLNEFPSLQKLPIAIEKIIGKKGIDLHVTELPSDISGILNVENKEYSIFVQESHHEHRQRFTMAHELGHFLIHHPETTHIDRKSYFRSPLSSTALDREEIEANRFAAAILMPKEMVMQEVKRFIETYGEDIIDTEEENNPLITSLATKFKVSPAAMMLRLQNLEILDGF